MANSYSSLAFANEFIKRAAKEGGVSHLKLQKLCFFAYGWWLSAHEKPIMTHPPKVWKYGPVFDDLYNVLAGFGGREIKEPQKLLPFKEAPVIPEGEKEIEELIDFVWARYGGYSAIKLSDMTHEPDTPWEIVARENEYRVPRNTPIPDYITAAYFKKISAAA